MNALSPFVRRALLALLFAVPVGYVSMILAVALHEVVGHGGVALAYGGEFHRFRLELDGMGRAWTTAPDHRIAVLAGGIVVESLLGFALLGVTAVRRVTPLVRMVLVVFALALLHDGLPYGLWDAVLLGTTGDVGRILRLADAPWLRPALLVGLGGAYVAAFLWGTRAVLRAVHDVCGAASSRERIVVSVALTAAMTVGYFAFDWDQLIDGAGLMPTLGAMILQAAACLAVLRWDGEAADLVEGGGQQRWGLAIAAAWGLAAITVGVLLSQPETGWVVG